MADRGDPSSVFDACDPFAWIRPAEAEAALAWHKKNFEALAGAGQAAFEGWQAIARRQAEAAWASIGDAPLLLAGSPDAAPAAAARAAAEMAEVAGVARRTRAAAFGVLRRRMAEGVDEIRDLSGA